MASRLLATASSSSTTLWVSPHRIEVGEATEVAVDLAIRGQRADMELLVACFTPRQAVVVEVAVRLPLRIDDPICISNRGFSDPILSPFPGEGIDVAPPLYSLVFQLGRYYPNYGNDTLPQWLGDVFTTKLHAGVLAPFDAFLPAACEPGIPSGASDIRWSIGDEYFITVFDGFFPSPFCAYD